MHSQCERLLFQEGGISIKGSSAVVTISMSNVYSNTPMSYSVSSAPVSTSRTFQDRFETFHRAAAVTDVCVLLCFAA